MRAGGGDACDQRYSASTSSLYAVSIARRFNFSDGVSSPCSSENWWARIRKVRIDSAERRVEIVLRPARVLGIEVTELATYDEQSGLWNPFRPADRDAIFREARRQLGQSAEELGLAKHAEASARALVEALIKAEGYTAAVSFAPAVTAPAD